MLHKAVFSQNDFKYTPAWKWALCYVTKGTATVLIPLPVIVLHAEASICHLPKNWNWQHGISLRRRRRIQSRTVWLLQPLIGGSRRLRVRQVSKSPRNEVRVPGILHANRCLMHPATKPSTEADYTAPPPDSIIIDFFCSCYYEAGSLHPPFHSAPLPLTLCRWAFGGNLGNTFSTDWQGNASVNMIPLWYSQMTFFQFWRGAAVSRPPGPLPQDLMSVAKGHIGPGRLESEATS